ncbi:hypothetical protein LC048_24745 [Mesobacillus subterraneus]|uniref:hypothetical protein n=1 Tax=Mesobacillus subterraneus TaxID=285983 RepID=UPI001CFD2466|nr:hypothetical protein [Mesobacillus subterraneus]WLR55427.1 hypothetical protein LC048_24745 [Mesobacillus subterraneus]
MAFYSQYVSVEKMNLIKREVTRAGQEMQSYRPGEPFTQLEMAFGYAAFMKWLALALQKQQNNSSDFYEFYEGCNHSAREIATQFMELAYQDAGVNRALRHHYGSLDGRNELRLAGQGLSASFNPEWNGSLTRAVIMICRQLAYFYTGVLGDTFDLAGKGISWNELNDASSIWLSEVLN